MSIGLGGIWQIYHFELDHTWLRAFSISLGIASLFLCIHLFPPGSMPIIDIEFGGMEPFY